MRCSMSTSPPSASEIWFLTGSQGLYGAETLDQVANQSRGSPRRSPSGPSSPVRVVWKPVLHRRRRDPPSLLEANADDAAASA